MESIEAGFGGRRANDRLCGVHPLYRDLRGFGPAHRDFHEMARALQMESRDLGISGRYRPKLPAVRKMVLVPLPKGPLEDFFGL
jgi:hypothetical protein